jgi:sulfatase modifying factor 1
MSPTGNHWCSYPDSGCASGLRYSNEQVGDGVSGNCVARPGVDAGLPTDGGMSGATASCLALPHTCGVTGADDCCNSLMVTGGTFFRAYDAAGAGGMTAPATISSFRLDKYEVTVGRFRAFVAAGQGTQVSPPQVAAGTHPHIAGSGWQAAWNSNFETSTSVLAAALRCVTGAPTAATFATWTDAPDKNENRPINCLTWYEAMAFCAWDGGYLPTDAEWNYAAAGGDQQRAYPWSSPADSLTVDSARASYNGLGDGSQARDFAPADIIMVGTKPNGDGRWGQSDLGGNVDEWTLDTSGPLPLPCNDCANLTVNFNRDVRGGNWLDFDFALRTSRGSYYQDALRNVGQGVRCARSL